MLNNMQIIGNVTADALERTVNTARGEALVLSFSVAITEFFSGKEITTYFRVSAWNALAERLSGKISKGSLVFVSGRVRMNTYTNNNNEEKSNLEISANSISVLRRPKDYQDDSSRPREYEATNRDNQQYTYKRKDIAEASNSTREDIVDLRNEDTRSNLKTDSSDFKSEVMDFDSVKKTRENYVAQSGIGRFNEDNRDIGLENPSIKKDNIDFNNGDDEYE